MVARGKGHRSWVSQVKKIYGNSFRKKIKKRICLFPNSCRNSIIGSNISILNPIVAKIKVLQYDSSKFEFIVNII